MKTTPTRTPATFGNKFGGCVASSFLFLCYCMIVTKRMTGLCICAVSRSRVRHQTNEQSCLIPKAGAKAQTGHAGIWGGAVYDEAIH
jgi:hypothetical protein